MALRGDFSENLQCGFHANLFETHLRHIAQTAQARDLRTKRHNAKHGKELDFSSNGFLNPRSCGYICSPSCDDRTCPKSVLLAMWYQYTIMNL